MAGAPRARPQTIADVAALVSFSRQSFTRAFGHLYAPEDLAAFLDEYRSPARFTGMIADAGKVLTVAEQAGQVVGYSTLEFGAQFDARPDPQPLSPCILGQLYCEPGQGIGGALLLASVVVAGGLGRTRTGWVLAGTGTALLTAAFLAA